MVPLVSSFMLSTKEGKKAWVEPVIDGEAPGGWRFEVRTGQPSKADEDDLKKGTKTGRGSNFTCVLTGTAINGEWVKAESAAGRMTARLMAIVAEGGRSRTYLSPIAEHEAIAATADPAWEPEGNLPNDPRNFWTVQYGLTTFASLFTPRQLVALTTYSDLLQAAREAALRDANASHFGDDALPLAAEGLGAVAYADAIATYLAMAVSKLTDAQSSLARWKPAMDQAIGTFGRQALPMVWDYAESNTFSGMAGDFSVSLKNMMRVLADSNAKASGSIANIDATKNGFPIRPVVFSTDPPYYDNISYADLSDYFYVWLRRSLSDVWPDLFRRLITPKAEELIATPYRHGGKSQAESFFMRGMGNAISSMEKAATDGEPLAIYYAYKQSEIAAEGVFSAGWTSFLQAAVDSGLSVDGTWPIRTELANRIIAKDANYLASSVVLVCRKRPADADVITRADFIRALKREMPAAIEAIRKAGVGPVDMQQSVIGPGMGVFSRHSKVLEDDDSAMSVKTALALINRVWEEIENELDQAFDAETQVALAWFATYGFDARASGELITLTTAKNTSDRALFASGVFKDMKGKAGLTPREELPPGWSPAGDRSLTVWECVQHTARVLNAPDGGGEAAAALVAQMGPKAGEARALAYRLFEIATNKGWAAEALVYNELAQEWTKLEDVAATLDDLGRVPGPNQPAFTFEGTA